jgi:hypothetical protein
MQTTATTSADSSSSSNAPSSMHGCIAAYVEAEIDKRGMRKRVQRLRSLRKTGEAFETTFRLLEDCESALGIEEKEEEGGVVVQFWTTRQAMQALKPRLVKALKKGIASRGVHKKRSVRAFIHSITPRFAGVSAVTDSHLVCRKLVLDEEKLAEYRQTPAGERLFLETVIEPMIATLDYGDMSDDE